MHFLPHIFTIYAPFIYPLFTSKSTRTNFSESPLHLLTRVEAEILKNVVSHSDATALANNVLPVPGGPWRRMPFQGLKKNKKIKKSGKKSKK